MGYMGILLQDAQSHILSTKGDCRSMGPQVKGLGLVGGSRVHVGYIGSI